jgi:hypothetical protein
MEQRFGIGVTRVFGIGNWDGAARGVEKLASGGGASGKVSHSSSSSSSYPSFSLTPVEYYCNEPFTLPNWVNSGNNDAQKLRKQLKRSSTRPVVVLVITMMTLWVLRERERYGARP